MSEQYYKALADTEYGEVLQNNVRFGRFKPSWLANELWVDMLGADVNNYEHMEYTAGITAWYIYEAERLGEPFSRENQSTLMMTAWTHDFAEAIDGDVPDPHKVHTEEQYEKERQSFLRVARSVCSTPELMGVVVFPVLYGDIDLARHFRAIEIIGYAETAMKAGTYADRVRMFKKLYDFTPNEIKDVHIALGGLYREVLPSAIRQLQEFKDLPVVRAYLDGRTGA